MENIRQSASQMLIRSKTNRCDLSLRTRSCFTTTPLHRNCYAQLTDKKITSKKASQPMNRGAGFKLRHGLHHHTPRRARGQNFPGVWDGGGQEGAAIVKREQSCQGAGLSRGRAAGRGGQVGPRVLDRRGLVILACQPPQREREEACSPRWWLLLSAGAEGRELLATLDLLSLRGGKPGSW